MALYQPMQGPAPSSARSIKDYITLVENEEAQYSNSNRDTKLMLTRLRKIYYDTDGWNKTLIADTTNIPGHYKRKVELDGQPYTINFGVPGALDDLTVRKTKSIAVDTNGVIPDIFKQQEVKIADGSYLDIGHVFAGLDAFNYLAPVSDPLGILVVDRNVDNCTWIGDLGSILAETFFREARQGTSISDSQRQEEINKNAPAQDMLGNIDAYVIKQLFNLVSGKKVSEILREYYLGEYYSNISQAASTARKYRFSKFSQGIGLVLQGRNPVTFSNETQWASKYSEQVGNSAAQYIYVNTQGFNARVRSVIRITFNQYSQTIVKLFIATLKQRISAEPGS